MDQSKITIKYITIISFIAACCILQIILVGVSPNKIITGFALSILYALLGIAFLCFFGGLLSLTDHNNFHFYTWCYQGFYAMGLKYIFKKKTPEDLSRYQMKINYFGSIAMGLIFYIAAAAFMILVLVDQKSFSIFHITVSVGNFIFSMVVYFYYSKKLMKCIEDNVQKILPLVFTYINLLLSVALLNAV